MEGQRYIYRRLSSGRGKLIYDHYRWKKNPEPDKAETYIRPRMAKDEVVWSKYVMEKAKEVEEKKVKIK